MNHPRSLYVHLPFCRHRCGYCNFALVTGRDHWIDRYLNWLEVELQHRAEQHWLTASHSPFPLDTLYLGGGTPSHLSIKQLEKLFQALSHYVAWLPETEVTIEANPIDMTIPLVDAFVSWGINRVSLGGQSFNDQKLKRLDRDHSGSDVREALEVVLARLPNVSLDLIFGAPDESVESWQEDLEAAYQIGVPHLSTYGLTIEKGTQFWSRREKGDLSEVPEDDFTQLYQQVIEFATRKGWEHYEVSSFARPRFRSRHNSVYWSGLPYEAIGAGAARFVEGVRETNHMSTSRYMQLIEAEGQAVAERDELSARERAQELMVIGLRQIDGLNAVKFHERTGFSFEELGGSALERLCAEGWLERTATHLRLTPQGLPISDSLWGALLAE